MDKIIVALGGMAGMIFVYWFFLRKDEKQVEVTDAVDIVVDGGYAPEVISIPLGKTTTLNFIRRDPNACLEEVVLGDFRIRKFLPLHQKVSVELTPQVAGEFTYACGMNMYHGKIKIFSPEQKPDQSKIGGRKTDGNDVG